MANEVLLTVTEEERRIAREISENNYQRMLKFESEIAREKGYVDGHAEGRTEGHAEGYAEGIAAGHSEGYADGHTQGHAEGISEGYEKGEASGIQKGLNQGLLEGAYKNKLETARNLLEMGLSVSQISKATGLSKIEIDEL
ncbi:MAG: hypothetical protein P1P64_07995 [Treponemataceae bacterium]